MSLVIGKLMKKFRLLRLVRIGGIDAVDVVPDAEFVGVHHMSDQRTGKIRTVPAERRDTSIARRADKAGDDRNQSVLEKRQKNFAAAPARFLDQRPGVTEGIAG